MEKDWRADGLKASFFRGKFSQKIAKRVAAVTLGHHVNRPKARRVVLALPAFDATLRVTPNTDEIGATRSAKREGDNSNELAGLYSPTRFKLNTYAWI